MLSLKNAAGSPCVFKPIEFMDKLGKSLLRHLANLKYFMSILKIVQDTYYIIYFICLMKIDMTLEKQIRFLKYSWLAKVSLLIENFAS